MATIGNNTSGKIQRTRDAFFSTETEDALISENGGGELDYLKELLKKSDVARRCYRKFRQMDAEILYKEADKRINSIEQGQVKEKDLEKVEAEICLLLGAIEDLHLEKVLELDLDTSVDKKRPENENVQEYTL